MADPRAGFTAGVLVSGLGLAAAVTLGAVWTAVAVVDGNMVATVARFLLAISAGSFYLILLRAARGPAE